MRFTLVCNKNPFPFPPPVSVDIDPFFAQKGTQLVLKSYEYLGGPFNTGAAKFVDHEAVVVNVKNSYTVSYERGFEDDSQLPVLYIEFK